MNRPVKIFIVGIVIAAATLCTGRVITWKLHSDRDSLVAECEAESTKTDNRLVCEPETLMRLGSANGIQAKIAEAQRELTTHSDWSISAAILFAIMGSLPFAWYFFLARVRELRNVIVGK
jgi:hypothetical protein